jgi:dTDP-L-rhamnose 4-epimerase
VKPVVLVTGGAGFIGSHVVDSLVERGYRVRVFDKLVEQVHGGRGPRYVHEDAEFVLGDMCDADALAKALRGVGAVVHLAAEVGVGQSMYEIRRYVEGNAVGTATMLELLAGGRYSVERLVVSSSMSIYGEGAYRCGEHGRVHTRTRAKEQLAAKDWEMRCPICRETIKGEPTPTTSGSSRSGTSIRTDRDRRCRTPTPA